MSQIKKGVILSFVTIFLTNTIGLVLTPLMIRKFGNSEFGLYNLIGAFVGTLSILDLGLNNTIIRFVSKYRAEKDTKGQENFLAMSMLIYFAIAGILVIMGAVFYFNTEALFGHSMTADELYKTKIMMIILIFNLALTVPGGAFTAICSGYEEFVFPRMINIARYVVRSVMLIAVLMLGGKSISVIVMDTVFNLLVIAITAFFVFKKLKVKIKLTRYDKPLVKEIFSYSLWIFINALILQFQWKIGQVILGSHSGTAIVAIYALGIMLGTYYGTFSSAISSVFLPRATTMTVNNSTNAEMVEEMTKTGRIMFIFLGFVFGGFFLFGKEFIHLWVGDKFEDAWWVVILIMLATTLPLTQSFASLILQAKNKMRWRTIASLVCNSLGLLLGFLLMKPYGIIGMALGTAIGISISFMVLNYYYQVYLHIMVAPFFKGIFGKLTLSVLIVMAINYYLPFFHSFSWVNLVLQFMLYSLIFLITMWLLGMNAYEKEMVAGFFKKKLK